MWRFINFGSAFYFLAIFFAGGMILLAILGGILKEVNKRWHPVILSACSLLFLIAAIFVFGDYVIAPASKEYKRVSPFLGHLSEYASIDSKGVDHVMSNSSATDGPSSRKSRKVIVIDLHEDMFGPKIDPLFFDLPADVRATGPEEVGTIVTIAKGTRRVGTYSDSKGVEEPALTQVWQVNIYDESTGQFLSHSSFAGDSPPQGKREFDSGVGGSPDFGVKNLIISFYRSGR